MEYIQTENLRNEVEQSVLAAPVIDIHTHLFAPNFGPLALWGIDEVVTYHYLIAELFRSWNGTPEQFWAMNKTQQADLIWNVLFVRNTPLSEACRGVVAVLTAFGLDPSASDLREARAFFSSQTPEEHFENVLRIANVSELVMTNDPFNKTEQRVWNAGGPSNPKFRAALRMDPLLNDWPLAVEKLSAGGYEVRQDFSGRTVKEVRRFLDEWIELMRPLYMAVSLPWDFRYPDNSAGTKLLREAILPASREQKVPFAMMIGVARAVNPLLGDAGDAVGHSDIRSVEYLCRENPDNRFLVTLLSRENQHELCVAARKFGNLMPFGCWWFLNNPSIIAEITSERVEMLGASFVPQHSDARILEQVIYKWKHSRRVIADVLHASYLELLRDGRRLSRAEIDRDVARLFSGNFREWVGLTQAAGV